MLELSIGATIGPFTITESMPAGSGGMSRVFIAAVNKELLLGEKTGGGNVDTLPDKVALKIARIVPPSQENAASEQAFYFEALNNEVEILKRLRHPNIVRLFPIPRGLPRNPYAARATELPSHPWFCVMEYLGGGSLDSLVKNSGALPVAEALEVAYQIGLALDHIHAKGLAHLDLKPDNILFRFPTSGRRRLAQPVLIDFGIAAKAKKTGPHAGSVAFMPPERIRLMRGETAPEQVGDQSKVDVYGLGVLLYRMLTEQLPYEGLPRDKLTSAILSTSPKPPRDLNPAIPPKIDEIIMAALEKEPDQRPRVEEIITRLDEAIVARPQAPRSEKPRRRFSRGTRVAFVLAAALFLCSIISVVEFGVITANWLLARQQPTPTVVVVTATPEHIEFATQPPTATPTLVASPTSLPATPTLTPIPPP
ncbi:MAG: serine/threonine protein kinase [Chloroflexi bacterium]|nr:serine/threonine protein kinase [Chloroflexota bacterium]